MPKTDTRLSRRSYGFRLPEELAEKIQLRAAELGIRQIDVVRHALAVGLAAEDHQGRGNEKTAA